MTDVSQGTDRTVPSVEDASRRFVQIAERSNTLYSLSADYVRVLDLLESGDIDDEEVLEDELDRLGMAITHKAEAIAGLVAYLDGIASVRRKESDRLLVRARADEHHAEQLRAYVLKHMQAIGKDRIDTARYTLAVRSNPPAVEVVDDQAVPSEFIKTVITTSVDRRRILEHLRETGEVPDGVEIVRRQRLEIR